MAPAASRSATLTGGEARVELVVSFARQPPCLDTTIAPRARRDARPLDASRVGDVEAGCRGASYPLASETSKRFIFEICF